MRKLLDDLIVYTAEALIVVAILAALWLWAGATMVGGPARTYQCSVGNQKPWVCDDIIRQQSRSTP